MKLVIVESPSKSKTIQKYLGSNYKVLASGGHVCDLPERSLGIDIKNNFQPEYVVSPSKTDILKKLNAALKSCDEVYLATDPDREGEAISWHLSNVLKLKNAKRIEFNEISKNAVKKALENPRDINIRLVDAQQARRILDRLVGYKVSPILNKKIKRGLSGGRVQSAALKMIVDREKQIKAFKAEEYWNIFAFLTKIGKATVMKCSLNDFNGKKIKITSEKEAKIVESDCKNANYVVDKVKRGVSNSHPSPPFTTSTMQQDGSHRLGLSAPDVMRVAQQLYEGIEIEGEGQIALVTYIRTDSVRVSSEAQQAAKEYIVENYGEEYVPKKFNFYKTKASGVQDAHEAIRPISLELTPEKLKSKIGRNQYRLYKLIYDRFVASQMTEAKFDTLNVHINAEAGEGNYGFKISGKTVVFKGYTIVYDNESVSENDQDNKNNRIPDLHEGENLSFKDFKTEQKFTKPPARYTDATLVKAMEENGIGRPSTYATVIRVLAKRNYTEKENKTIKPTNLGEVVDEFMEKNFSDIVDTKFTANMENQLDTIENGTEWQKILRDFYPPFEKSLEKAENIAKKMKVVEEVSDVKCEKCGAMMVVKIGRYGKFLACPNFPKCRNIKSIQDVVGKCPVCGGDIVKKKTKKGRIFYGCGNYPNCNFMSWDLPAPILCPECNSTMKIVKKGDKTNYICSNKNCNYVILKKEEDKDFEE